MPTADEVEIVEIPVSKRLLSVLIFIRTLQEYHLHVSISIPQNRNLPITKFSSISHVIDKCHVGTSLIHGPSPILY